MRQITLKSIDTEFMWLKNVHTPINVRVDSDLYDPASMEPQPFHYKENLRAMLNFIPRDHMGNPVNNPEEFGIAIRLLGDLRELKNGDIWLVEEADHAFIMRRVKAFPWPSAELWYGRFQEDVEKATKIEPKAAEPTPIRAKAK